MAEAGVAVTLEAGRAYESPSSDACFDSVFASLLLHHLTGEQTQCSLPEILRVLVPGD